MEYSHYNNKHKDKMPKNNQKTVKNVKKSRLVARPGVAAGIFG